MENNLFNLEPDRMEIKVRLSIFTIVGVCAGLPAFVWSVRDLIHHRKNGRRISANILLLLLTDFVELILSPYLLVIYLSDKNIWTSDWTIQVFWFLLSYSRVSGLFFNQLVALEGILSETSLLCTACFLSCLKFFYTLVFLCIIICGMFLVFDVFCFIFIIFLLGFIVLVTGMISCGASCSANFHTDTSWKPDHHILVVFIFSLLVFYLPDFVCKLLLSFTSILSNLANIPSFLMSMRLISDPLLCVLVSRQNLRIQTSLKPEGTSLV